MRIALTGASGRLGRAIYVRLAPGHQIVGMDRTPSSTVAHVGDIGDAGLLRRALPGCDAIIHTAALHAPHVDHVPDSEFERINIDATARLLDVAQAAGIPRIVFTSTTALYGDAATPVGRAGWVDEALPPQPRTIYHRSKLAAEALLRQAAEQGGPRVTILRVSRCFPEPAPLMAVYRLHRGIDARDVAEAHALALQDAAAPVRLYVISGATPFRRDDAEALFDDATRVIRERAPALATAFCERGWPLPPRIDRVYDPALAMHELGWRPRYGFDEVLAWLDQGLAEVLPPQRDWTPR